MSTPMFPLGSVLLPGGVLPLHVFEPRYRTLVQDCLAGSPEFGVVLIERGSEVGGGEQRSSVGTIAHIVEAAELPDGRWAVVSVGTERVRVERWLEDDPYPRALVAPWPDPAPSDQASAHLEATVTLLRRVLAVSAELGDAVAPATTDLSEDLHMACYQACTLAPLGPADHFDLLRCEGVDDRLALLGSLLVDLETDLSRRLAMEGPPGSPGDG